MGWYTSVGRQSHARSGFPSKSALTSGSPNASVFCDPMNVAATTSSGLSRATYRRDEEYRRLIRAQERREDEKQRGDLRRGHPEPAREGVAEGVVHDGEDHAVARELQARLAGADANAGPNRADARTAIPITTGTKT